MNANAVPLLFQFNRADTNWTWSCNFFSFTSLFSSFSFSFVTSTLAHDITCRIHFFYLFKNFYFFFFFLFVFSLRREKLIRMRRNGMRILNQAIKMNDSNDNYTALRHRVTQRNYISMSHWFLSLSISLVPILTWNDFVAIHLWILLSEMVSPYDDLNIAILLLIR